MPYLDLPKPGAITYDGTEKPLLLGYLQQENQRYILLENGAKILVYDRAYDTLSKPSQPSYTSILKPTI